MVIDGFPEVFFLEHGLKLILRYDPDSELQGFLEFAAGIMTCNNHAGLFTD